MSDLQLALIGNSRSSAFLDGRARIVWACLPRFDSEPVFDSLLKDGEGEPNDGFYEVEFRGAQPSGDDADDGAVSSIHRQRRRE
ncbi:MAG TPA: trehalase-like domain-containing protein [Vicinamibacteria bacterium]|nr:trehalase-like domain-containing protein [Vicinamibacteria bacterium]